MVLIIKKLPGKFFTYSLVLFPLLFTRRLTLLFFKSGEHLHHRWLMLVKLCEIFLLRSAIIPEEVFYFLPLMIICKSQTYVFHTIKLLCQARSDKFLPTCFNLFRYTLPVFVKEVQEAVYRCF